MSLDLVDAGRDVPDNFNVWVKVEDGATLMPRGATSSTA